MTGRAVPGRYMESLLVRVSTPDMSSAQLHTALLTTIRSEFEHNLSQQIYMSPQSWEVVKNARSNTIKTINNEAEKMPPTATGIDLSRQLLTRIMELEKEPTRVAIDFKGEVADDLGSATLFKQSTLLLTKVLRSAVGSNCARPART
jgi:hypothetical protein